MLIMVRILKDDDLDSIISNWSLADNSLVDSDVLYARQNKQLSVNKSIQNSHSITYTLRKTKTIPGSQSDQRTSMQPGHNTSEAGASAGYSIGTLAKCDRQTELTVNAIFAFDGPETDPYS